MPDQSRAIVMRAYGPPAVLKLESVPLPALAEDEIRIRSIVSAVNHSDLDIRSGKSPIHRAHPFPYIPGLEVVGEVVATGARVTDIRLGQRVITMMQGMGGVRADRPGGYAEFVTIPAAAAALLPHDLDPCEQAALGLVSVVAFEGLQKLGQLNGKRVAITGASGGVGSAAIGIAKAQGAAVVAIVSRPERAEYVRSLGADEVVTADDLVRGALPASSLDAMLDTVAGDAFSTCLSALRPGSIYSLVGTAGGGKITLDASRLMGVTLTGYSSETLDSATLRRLTRIINDWLRRGMLAPPAHQTFPLENAAAAHEGLESHTLYGRVLLSFEP